MGGSVDGVYAAARNGNFTTAFPFRRSPGSFQPQITVLLGGQMKSFIAFATAIWLHSQPHHYGVTNSGARARHLERLTARAHARSFLNL